MLPRSSSRVALRRTLAAALLVAVLPACGTLSVPDERGLGEQFSREMRKELVFVRDEVVVGYVQRIGRDLVRAAGPQPFEYHFYVVDNPEINAFAGPAGHIYLHTETILKARNVSELAGVIAHEIGHVARRHIAHNYNRQRGVGIAHQVGVLTAGILGGSAAAGVANLGGGLAAMAYLNSFGREAEGEADAFAVETMPRAGYEPEGLLTFFQTLQREGGAGVPSFLSSHPATSDRIAQTRRLLAQQPRRAGLRVDDGGQLEIIQQRVRLVAGERKQRRSR